MAPRIPNYSDTFLPTHKAVQRLGGSSSVSEIVSAVIEQEGNPEEQEDMLQNDGPETGIGFRDALARTYLKYFGLLTNSERGVWSITEAGDKFLSTEAPDTEKIAELMRLKVEQVKADGARHAA